MKPFDIEAAKRGDPVVTRNGFLVELLAFDMKADNKIDIAGIKITPNGTRLFETWHADGSYMTMRESINDLFMASKTISGFVNVYKPNGPGSYIARLGDVYATEREALETRLPGCVATVPITWEE